MKVWNVKESTKPYGWYIYITSDGGVSVSGVAGKWEVIARNDRCIVLKKAGVREAMGSRSSLLGSAYYPPEIQVFQIAETKYAPPSAINEGGQIIGWKVEGLISWETKRKEKNDGKR